MENERLIYYVSGSTGILARDFGKALLCQFTNAVFHEKTIPFIKTEQDARSACKKILREASGRRPIVISTLLNKNLNQLFNRKEINLISVLDDYLRRLETILDENALWQTGYSRHDDDSITRRVDAIHYTIGHDDGVSPRDYHDADLILIGVSRSGKTPVSVYLATQMGLKTANFPLVGENLTTGILPVEILQNKHKVIGLTISAENLHLFREKRYRGSIYANLSTCRKECMLAKQLFKIHSIPGVYSGSHSIEETATQVYHRIKQEPDHPDQTT